MPQDPRKLNLVRKRIKKWLKNGGITEDSSAILFTDIRMVLEAAKLKQKWPCLSFYTDLGLHDKLSYNNHLRVFGEIAEMPSFGDGDFQSLDFTPFIQKYGTQGLDVDLREFMQHFQVDEYFRLSGTELYKIFLAYFCRLCGSSISLPADILSGYLLHSNKYQKVFGNTTRKYYPTKIELRKNIERFQNSVSLRFYFAAEICSPITYELRFIGTFNMIFASIKDVREVSDILED